MPARAKAFVNSWSDMAETAAQELRAYKKQVNADTNIRMRLLAQARTLPEPDPRLQSLIRAPLAGLR
jgi:hypothetical protein